MRRRQLITLIGGAAASPRFARAQQPVRIRRIGYLCLTSATQHERLSDAFRASLRELGYVEGRNLYIEFRFAEGDADHLRALASELAALNVDVLVTYATGVVAAKRATSTIPIVMLTNADAVATGVVASLAHPGGNVTGSTFFLPELMAKRLELLKEVVPSIARAGVLVLLDNPSNGPVLRAMEGTAKASGVELQPIEVRGPAEFESAFSAWADKQVDALVMTDPEQLLAYTNAIAALAAKYHLPSAGPLELTANGGLVAYGVSFSEQFRRAAVFVDKILKGTKPSDIPVEQATKFVTIINLKTAKTLGLDIPATMLGRADEVIE